MGGTYTLLIELPEPATVAVGALGEQEFPTGWYAYTGSALGPGGFSRIDRHHGIGRGERDVRHWHIDYLLGHDAARVERAVKTPDRDIECAVARALPDAGIDGFGAADCDCESHLAYGADREGLVGAAERAHGGVE